ncbi:hypothetical protein BKA69DRAFT_305268 [Paraphysoderma sedebokerense]|nr:hypothetical protein BKA69DRAFT_305268 [Paraphysoderma sedebokerense]
MTDDETSSSIKKIPSEEVTRPHLLDHHNKELVSQLKIIARQRQLMRDETRRYSKLSYERAISALIAHPRRVSSMDEVRNIPHIGSKIATKIGEFLSHGMISEAQDIQNSEWFHVCDTFAKIYGVGAKTAVEWYSKGYRSVEDVLEDDEFMQSLPETTRYGVEMFHDFQQRFDRPHAERLIKFITDELHQFDKRYIVTPVGGYCRGKTNLGDLDLIISYPASAITQSPTLQPVTNTDEPRLKNIKDFDVIDHLTRKLVDDGIIKYILSFTKRRDLSDQPAEVQEKYRVKSRIVKSAQKSLKLRMKRAAKEKTGGFDSLEKAFVAIKIPSDEHYRQLDLIFAPPEQYATGVLGWMGSTSIERSLRRVADSRGYSFSSDGLFNKGTGEYEVIKTEREIWDKLGLKYLEPWERNAD